MPRERDPAKRAERNRQILQDYRDPEITVDEIARRYGVSDMLVCELARKAGLPKRRERGRNVHLYHACVLAI
jgi:transposase-like protein